VTLEAASAPVSDHVHVFLLVFGAGVASQGSDGALFVRSHAPAASNSTARTTSRLIRPKYAPRIDRVGDRRYAGTVRSLAVVLASALAACGGSVSSGDVADAASGDIASADTASADTAFADTATLDSGHLADAHDSTVVGDEGIDTGPMEAPPTCEAGATICSGACADLAHDPKNCGSCGNACVFGVCCVGTCGGECPAGDIVCGDPCVCVNLTTDPDNCGACGKKCCAGESCSAGVCVVGCSAGMTACKDPTTGCGSCVDTTTDPRNCGGCGIACPPGIICFHSACE